MSTETKKPAPDRTRMLLAIAAVLGVITVIYYGVASVDDMNSEMAAARELREAQYLKLARIVQSGTQIEETHKALTAFRTQLAQQHFITAATAPLAEARFQNLVAELAKANGLSIRTSRSTPATAEDHQNFLNLTINASGEIGGIRDFLLQLRDNPTYMFVKQVEIRQISAKEKRNYYVNIQISAPTNS